MVQPSLPRNGRLLWPQQPSGDLQLWIYLLDILPLPGAPTTSSPPPESGWQLTDSPAAQIGVTSPHKSWDFPSVVLRDAFTLWYFLLSLWLYFLDKYKTIIEQCHQMAPKKFRTRSLEPEYGWAPLPLCVNSQNFLSGMTVGQMDQKGLHAIPKETV